MSYLLLVIGMLLLMKGADWFVDGSASVAKRLKVPSVIIGLTIVALGTSLPEASVSITASISGNNELAISNVVGSNIFNTLVVVGCSAMISPFIMDKSIVNRDLKINVIASMILAVFVLDGKLQRFEGFIFMVMLVLYIVNLVKMAMQNRIEEQEEKNLSIPMCILFIVIGVVSIKFGGDFVVNSASNIARQVGLSDTFIGLTIVSIGTSLPELVTSIVAAKKNESGLSLGNAVGSNIMNIMFILGTSSFISPIATNGQNVIDAFILVVIALFIVGLSRISHNMTRKKGFAMVMLYAAYMVYILVR